MKNLYKLTTLLIAVTMSTSLMAADQVVTSNANSGAGTLRQAIVDAGDDDEITFNLASGSETIIISSELGITESLTINGANISGSGTAVIVQVTTPGTSTWRVFNINASGKTINLNNLTLRGGDISGASSKGGAILVDACGALNIDYILITDSKAYQGGGISLESGLVTISNSTISNNETLGGSFPWGGGIYLNGASLTAENTTISSNQSAGYGGGVHDRSASSYNNCTFFNNTTGQKGGGLFTVSGAVTTIESSTFLNNRATSSGGGICENGPTLTINNTILVNNYKGSTGYTGDDFLYLNGTLVNNGYNVVEYQSGSSLFSDATDILYSGSEWQKNSSTLSNQTLDIATSLSFSGGFTETIAVTGGGFLTASEGYGFTTETTDQRGYYHTSSTITRGAYQYNGVVAKIGSGTSWTGGSSTYSTIQSAVDAASSGNTVVLAGTAILIETDGSDIEVDIDETLTIEGAGATSTIVRVATPGAGGTVSRVFNINASGKIVNIQDMTIKGGDISANGETAAGYGGGIYVAAGTLNLNTTTVTGSKAYHGGGIYNEGTITNIVNSSITGNTAGDEGGGIWNEGTITTISRSTISSNESTGGKGGAIYTYATIGTITNVTISDNTSDTWGGGICLDVGAAIVTINNSTIANNQGTLGGGIMLNASGLIISNTILANNTATSISASDDYYYAQGTLTDNGYNVVKSQSGGSTGSGKTFTSITDILYNTKADGTSGYSTWNQNNVDLGNQNLNLSSTLSDNGGPTLTLALSSGSFADGAIPYSAGTNTFNGSTDLDQRGYCRACDGSRDIGAYEYDATTPSNGDYISIATGNWSSTSTWNTYNSTTKLWADASSEPASDKNVTISNGDAVTVDGTGDAANALTVSEGATLTISDTKDLDINGNLVNSGTFTINSSASGTGSLIVEGTATGSVVMHRYIAAATWGTWDDGWHFLSSPVANYPIATNFTATDYDFYAWSEKYNVWVNYKDGTNPAFDDEDVNGSNNFELGRGYLAAYKLESTRNFTGTINVANVEITGLTITGEGNHRSWHLLGNPFNSALTWYTDWTKSNIAGTAKIWHEGNKSYSDIAADGIIPATNGFMVQASGGTGTLTIPKAERIHSATVFYKSSEYPIIKLKATNIDYPSAQESQLRFNPKSTFGWDMEFDGDFLSGFAPHFYSTVEGVPQSVNSMPDLKGTTAVPFTFIKNDGLNFSIELYEVENMVLDVWLLDKKLNNNHNLSQNPLYLFTAFEQDDHERFVIQFAPVGIDEEQSPHSNIQTWASNKTIHIVNPENSRGEIRVLNLFGQQVAQAKLTGDTKQQIQLNVPTGCYLVNVVSEEGVVTRKVMVN